MTKIMVTRILKSNGLLTLWFIAVLVAFFDVFHALTYQGCHVVGGWAGDRASSFTLFWQGPIAETCRFMESSRSRWFPTPPSMPYLQKSVPDVPLTLLSYEKFLLLFYSFIFINTNYINIYKQVRFLSRALNLAAKTFTFFEIHLAAHPESDLSIALKPLEIYAYDQESEFWKDSLRPLLTTSDKTSLI